ncbi:hypothetical protein [Atopococcus tabaci]|uniref:hypothetical protein n=1 Tax=Atopococcus tabaci TaxID=269774 RepID=UPI000416A2CE|nr:hypothetical protein [Atopococcus tabaci]
MKNWKTSALLLASTLVLTACGTQTQEAGEDTAETVNTAQVDTSQSSAEQVDTASQPVEETDVEATYENMLAQGREEYEAGLLDAAGGTLTLLLENDLSQYEAIETEALDLQEEIKAAQAEKAREEMETVPEETAYATERQSVLAAEEFNKATGEDIQSVSDEEIGAWLDEKEQAEAEKIQASATEDTSEAESVLSEEELLQQEQQAVLESVIRQLGLEPEGRQFFLVKTDEQTYQVEIRQPHAVEDVEISNMLGIFEYNMETGTLKKMNPVTGEYEDYTK